ncbi:ABC transporter substrate-binding protein [Qingshengfaniella alkalisoli]|uniref:ABC transporter substrate-binding protein n=1 Tax=Qingshengfaniella alkalisoli TaxID=2599296 RepID=A0A5B8I925_9RHOB|nr:ABC transporter substrate-binding protein [Qingshengfaniella alkalisoli]QDY70655.1 ABC transporter substrate-binding protein [Qingshengfaniella alkalisoli]
MKNIIYKITTSMAVFSILWTGNAVAEYTEAPVLDQRVQNADLPPVTERLPEDPLVLEALEIGTYGGTWRSTVKGNNDEGWIRRSAGYDPLIRYTFDWNGIAPNIASSWDVSDNGLVYTFHLRAGHKWSDGTPFTAEDVLFAVNDVINSDDFVGARPAALFGVVASAPDPQTVVMTLPAPNSLFLEHLAAVDGVQLVNMQKAFCSQFHPDYNSDADAAAQSAGMTGWGEAMMINCGVTRARNPDRPTLSAWIQKVPYDGINTPVTFERNPYYFKVDQAGNQLPYIDNLRMTQVEDTNAIVLMGVAGEIDLTNRHIDSVTNKPVFYDNQEKGGYRLYDTIPSDMNTAIIQLNLTYEDDGFRTLFRNKDFRIALSHGIDRTEIIDAVYAGQGEPYQAAPRPESSFYNGELAKQYTEWSPDKANELLDKIGLTERNDDGVRLLPDGRPIRIRLDVVSDNAIYSDIMELVQLQLEDIGIGLDVRKAERSFVYEQKNNNKHMAHVWKGDGGLGDGIIDARHYLPMHQESAYAPLWARNWFDPGNPEIEEPPAEVTRQLDLYKKMYEAPTVEKRDELFRQILDIAQDQFYSIGISLPPNGFGIASNKMGNVPDNQPNSWVYPTPGPMNTSLLFFKE